MGDLDDSNTRLESQLAAAQAQLAAQQAEAAEQAKQHGDAVTELQLDAAGHAQLQQEVEAMRNAKQDSDAHVAALKVRSDAVVSQFGVRCSPLAVRICCEGETNSSTGLRTGLPRDSKDCIGMLSVGTRCTPIPVSVPASLGGDVCRGSTCRRSCWM